MIRERILKPFYDFFRPSNLAKKNTRFHGFLNRIINGCEIGHNFFVPKSTKIIHGNGIVIGQGCILGKNLKIFQNVTLGQKEDKYPKIGDNVQIYPSALVLGGIEIGDNSIVGAGTIVMENIEKNSIVFNKTKLIKKKLK